MSEPKTCFVICPFGEPKSKARKRSDMLLEYVITPAVSQFDYEVKRADLTAEPGVVTVHIIQHLIEDALLVADITDRNPNVFYELAIRHAIRKPFVQLIENGQDIPFNIQEIQTVTYNLDEVDEIKRSVDLIRKQILYYETTGKVTSPVSVAIDAMLGTSSVSQFEAIMGRLAELDQGVEDVAELKEELVKEVRSVIAEIKDQLDSKVIQEIEAIRKGMAGSTQTHSDEEKQRNDDLLRRIEASIRGHDPTSSPKAYSVSRWIEMEQERNRRQRR